MIKLNDYLGTLISSINQARVMADIESARVAKAYANDDLLKHFSIPRFRAQDIELDIPVAIDSFNESPVKDYQPIDNKSFNSHCYNTMKEVAKVSSFSRKTSKFLNSDIASISRELEQNMKASISKEKAYKKYEEKMSDVFIRGIQSDKLKVRDIQKTKIVFQNSLKEKLYNSIQTKESTNQLEDANVVVEASKLREIPSENIIRIKMKLFEDGMEWHTSENTNGDIESRLLPE
ncbi:hypothetical protein [Kordia sp.]|uniref:hypothetical protein n=1 Tax=Kordia sp. TaxID=1965332 RepID=UPI003D6BF371